MEQLVTQMRVLIYTVICFQCLLQITQGSIYQKYLKLFMYLLTLCICCQILTNFVDKLRSDWAGGGLCQYRMDAEVERGQYTATGEDRAVFKMAGRSGHRGCAGRV